VDTALYRTVTQATGADAAEALEPLKTLPGSNISGFNYQAWANANPAALQVRYTTMNNTCGLVVHRW
jgi:hypothetical protein